MGKVKSKTRKIILGFGMLLILCGIAGLLYPVVGNYINSFRFNKAIENYRTEVEKLPDTTAAEMLDEAREYNEWLYSNSNEIKSLTDEELERYNGLLQISHTGIMGYLDIPSISVSLPIYHGTSESVLQVGVGHLEGSSLPIGGENTHTILTGHSGLPSSRLFTDLDRLQIGDTFSITVLGNTATYEVYKTEIIEPQDARFSFEAGKDYCTLVTCTPIGVNTHRLLVYGVRTNETAESGTSVKEVTGT